MNVQLFPLAGRTPLHSPEQNFQNLHVAHVLNWNADGLSTKVQELRDKLAAESIDVCLTRKAHPPVGYHSKPKFAVNS